jgi:hypothetical protein
MRPVAQAMVALAARCLGRHRRDWALAMREELEAACADGRSLSFAWGCLTAAWHELPRHAEGRYMIASHGLAFVLIIPTAALLVASLMSGFPYSYLAALGGEEPLLSEGNLFALPSLALLLVVVAAAHLRIAWLLLERDWAGVFTLGTLLAAVSVTLLLFTGLVFVTFIFPLALAAALAIELAAIFALARWHAEAFGGASELLD